MRAIHFSLLIFIILHRASGKSHGWIKSKDNLKSSEDNEITPRESEETTEAEAKSKVVAKESDESKISLEKSTGSDSSSSEEEQGRGENNKPSSPWDKGTVPYQIDHKSYDDIIVRRIREAMKAIEAISCVIFKNMTDLDVTGSSVWLHITNSDKERDCAHSTTKGSRGETIMVIGFECMQKADIIHALLHALGFKDEVTHPQRDSYVRVLWENIQPKYHPLFAIQNEPGPYQTLVEYDTMSVMHFHDRAYSWNGGATIVPLISGLTISPSESLSPLDIMKLRLTFGHECNRRKVDNMLETCKHTLLAGSSGTASHSSESNSEEGGGNKVADKNQHNKQGVYNKRGSKERLDGDNNNLSSSNDSSEKIGGDSEKEETDSGSEKMAVVEIKKYTNKTNHPIDASKIKELTGSKWGVPGNRNRKGRGQRKKLRRRMKTEQQN